MRFKQLSLFVVISGLLLNAVNTINGSQRNVAVSSIGMMITSVLWIMEVRSSIHAQISRSKKRSLEERITAHDMGQDDLVTVKPAMEFEARWTHFNATNSVLCLYVISYLSWLCLFFWESNSHVLRIIGLVPGLVFLVLIAFSIREYVPLLRHAQRAWKW